MCRFVLILCQVMPKLCGTYEQENLSDAIQRCMAADGKLQRESAFQFCRAVNHALYVGLGFGLDEFALKERL